MTPIRVQLSRKKGWRMPPNTVSVARPGKWGNPFNATQIGVVLPHPDPMRCFPMQIVHLRTPPSLDRCLDMFAAVMQVKLRENPALTEPLRGKNLACWCPLDQPCHADILLRMANR